MCCPFLSTNYWGSIASRLAICMGLKMKQLNLQQIKEILPHRYPFLFLDRIEDYEAGKFAVGYKRVTLNEEFPLISGGLVVEALGQAGAIAILELEENRGKIVLLGGINHCEFHRPIQPGDQVRLETRVKFVKGPYGVGEAVASVDGQNVVSAEIAFVVT